MDYERQNNSSTNDLLEYLYGLNRLGIKVGLEHTIKLLKVCGNPEKNFPTIHIAGTNGKGSTSAMAASIFTEYGYKVGLYTSPHLISFNERIKVNNIVISDDEIATFINEKKNKIHAIRSTFFETTTAMAFDHFSKNKVDLAIIETGLGGRLDSTNVVFPSISAITPISIDHKEILGNDIITIAKEKAGIIKKNTPVIISKQKKTVKIILRKIAKNLNSPLIEIDKPKNIKVDKNGSSFSYKNFLYKTPLIGDHQALNASQAISIVSNYDSSINQCIIQKGLRKTIWPGRLQVMSRSKNIFYDVAHNADGFKKIFSTMKKIYNTLPLVLLVLKGDKEIDLIANSLKGKYKLLIISGDLDKSLMSGKQLGEKLLNKNLNNIIIENSFEIGMDSLVELSIENNAPGLILGSHYIAKSVFDKFGFFI